MLFHSGELQQCEGYSYILFPSGFLQMKVTITKTEGSKRPQSFADYLVIEHFTYSTLELPTVCPVKLSCWKYPYFLASVVS
jgi:hypothetical protein